MMEQLLMLLMELKKVTFQDMSELSEERRYQVLIQIEELQDQLCKLATEKLH